MRFRHILFAFWVFVASFAASGADAPSVKVANAWARATVPGQNTGAAYVDLTSDRGAVLVAAGSPLAARVELHSMTNDGGVMRMRQLPKVELPAGQTVRLEPNGVHLMLVELKQPLKPGDKLPLVLSVQSSGMSLTTLKIEAEVRAAANGAQHGH
ncbi:MAG TPA: copper chaperone PCu(A)C [Burkholderiales bacterium]|nr:copper chaperone PCu(A)C [Burkholderiales bacterium]